MNIEQKQTLIPLYMKEFKCIGSECGDTCCNGWTINIDKSTYKKYRKLNSPIIKTDIEESMKRNKKNSSDGYYAEFVLNSKGCPLQSEEGWCRVHSELGEDYLSNTCSIFPRMYNKVDSMVEMGGTVSCPEITRLALFNPNGIDFEVTVKDDFTRNHGKHNINTKLEKHKLFWEIRSFSIFILQDRRYSIENRLINLGMWINKIQGKNIKSLDELLININDYKNSLNNSELEKSLNNIKPNYKLNMKISYELLQVRKLLNIQNKRYIQLLSDISEGLKLEEENFDDNFNDLILKVNKEFYLPYFEKHEYILENYLVNDVFINCFGNDTEKLFEQFNLLVLKYALIKLHLYGVAAKYKELNDELVVYTIQSFSKCIEHNTIYLDSILKLIINNQWNSLAHMAILIKG